MYDKQTDNGLRKRVDPFEEKILRRIPLEIIVISFIFSVAVWILFDATAGLVFFVGGVMASANFVWLQKSLANILFQGKKRGLRSGIVLYLVRFLLILVVFSIIILFLPRKIFAFAAGFSTLLLVFLAEAIAGFLRIKQWKS